MASIDATLGKFSCRFEIWEPAKGKVFRDRFAVDTETTAIDADRPDRIPTLVLLVASDGERGVFVGPDSVVSFLDTHRDADLILHNAAFDLAVLQSCIGETEDIYDRVDDDKIWDTMILRRLLCLARDGQTACGESSLAHCASEFLGVRLEKRRTDDAGHDVRTGFARFLGRPITATPVEYLRYAAEDVLATWHLFDWQVNELRAVLSNADDAFGYAGLERLKEQVARYGPLTHHIQLRASIVCHQMTRNGICVDVAAASANSTELDATIEQCAAQVAQRGYQPGRKGNQGVLQRLIADIAEANPSLLIPRTPSGDQFATRRESLEQLSEIDPFFTTLVNLRHAQKMQKTYVSRLAKPRVHPKFGYLLTTGRTSCSGAINLQNLPKESGSGDAEAGRSIRSLLVPSSGNVFIDVDYSQIELVVLASVLRDQLRLGDSLANLINSGEDVHRRIAASVLGKAVDDVTKAERNSAKPISFGRPGGMAAATLQEIARKNYGMELSLDQVEERINAYHRLVPELNNYLRDEVDSALKLAQELNLTPRSYPGGALQAGPEGDAPAAWLGGMLLKVLRSNQPQTRVGRTYNDRETEYFWQAAANLTSQLSEEFALQIDTRRPSADLALAVQNLFGGRPTITATGRIRAKAGFCASRNTLFQGLAADGAIIGLWNLFRAGHRIVAFIHDQAVVECREADDLTARVAEIEELMIAGMQEVIPEMLIRVESTVSRSLDKRDVFELDRAALRP